MRYLLAALLLLLAPRVHADERVRAETRVQDVREQYGLTGEGVLVAVFDRGIDPTHRDFRNADGTTRLLAIYDLIDDAGAGDADNPPSFGTVYTRAELDAATEAMEGMAEPTGCIPTIADDRIMCNLAYVRVDGETLHVRGSRRARREAEKAIYTGQDLTDDPSQYVILINTPQSTGVLGEQASLFAEYVRDIGALKALLDGIVETQGRLEQQLGPIASRAGE